MGIRFMRFFVFRLPKNPYFTSIIAIFYPFGCGYGVELLHQ